MKIELTIAEAKVVEKALRLWTQKVRAGGDELGLGEVPVDIRESQVQEIFALDKKLQKHQTMAVREAVLA